MLNLSVAAVLAACVVATPVFAQTPRDLTTASLEDLMNVRITSASRKDQRAWDTAAAVYVIHTPKSKFSGVAGLVLMTSQTAEAELFTTETSA